MNGGSAMSATNPKAAPRRQQRNPCAHHENGEATIPQWRLNVARVIEHGETECCVMPAQNSELRERLKKLTSQW